MPRKSKNQSTAVVSPGQPYGIAGEQQAAMQTIPLPETRVKPNTQNLNSGSMGQEPSDLNSVSGANSVEQLFQNAQSMPAPDLNSFSAPSERPNEDLMTMPNQPVAGIPNQTAEILRMIARYQNNDPMLLAKAADAERLGY
jgi:hypothetical protein